MQDSAALAVVADQRAPVALDGRATDPRPYWVYLSTLGSAESRRAMQGCLDRVAALAGAAAGAECAWAALRYEHTSVLRATIASQGWSPSHANKHLSALRGVLRQCWKLGLMTAEDYERARDIEEVKGHREPAGRSIHGDEVAALLRSCAGDGNKPLGQRDAALLAILYSTGARCSETAGALIERYDARERSLLVTGKGDRERTVYVIETAAFLIGTWLACAGERRGPLLRPVDRWGTIAPRHLSPRSVGRIISERRVATGLAPMSTHDFRRTFGGDFLDAGGDLAQLQKLFGHASATTTASYDRREGRKLRAAVDKLALPGPDELARPA